jgi:hypothetical protein
MALGTGLSFSISVANANGHDCSTRCVQYRQFGAPCRLGGDKVQVLTMLQPVYCRSEAIARIARLIGLAAMARVMIEIDALAIASPLRFSRRRLD